MYSYDYPTYLSLHTRHSTTSTSGNFGMYISPPTIDPIGLKCSDKIVLKFSPYRLALCSASHWSVSHLNDDKSFSLLIMMAFMETPTFHHDFPSLWIFNCYTLILDETLLCHFGYLPKLVIFFPSVADKKISSSIARFFCYLQPQVSFSFPFSLLLFFYYVFNMRL